MVWLVKETPLTAPVRHTWLQQLREAGVIPGSPFAIHMQNKSCKNIHTCNESYKSICTGMHAPLHNIKIPSHTQGIEASFI